MQTENNAVGAPVEAPVRPGLAEALQAYWDAAYAEGAEGRDHDTEEGRAGLALRDVMLAVAAEIAAERERSARIAEAATKEQRESIAHLCPDGVCECRIAAAIRDPAAAGMCPPTTAAAVCGA